MRSHLLCFLLLVACDCSDPTGIGAPCTTRADCELGLVCVDDACALGNDGSLPDAAPDVPVMQCETDERVCGDNCCPQGASCDGVSCCAAEDLCGGVCCGEDNQGCVANVCVLRCGDDEVSCGEGAEATCCGGEDVCYAGACTTPGGVCERLSDCAETDYCEVSIGRCLPRITAGEACTYEPDIENFELTEEWSWLGDAEVVPDFTHVMHTPVVANLTDDNADGVIDENDIPDVVFSTFRAGAYPRPGMTPISSYVTNGVLRAVSGDDGHRLWPTAEPAFRVNPASQTAIAELDAASPGPEIITCSSEEITTGVGVVLMLAADGSLLRRFEDAGCGAMFPAIADMDSDGVPEIFTGRALLHADGTVVATFPANAISATLSDVDADPQLEVVTGNAVFDMDGTEIWSRRAAGPMGVAIPNGGTTAVADFNLDGNPEVVYVLPSLHHVYVLDAATGADFWDAEINPPEVAGRIATQQAARPDRNASTGGGPPTIANFDDDPEPELALAGGYAYIIFDSDGSRLWFTESQDISSRVTGSSIFDFEGDGVAEVLYNDETRFRVFRGNDGSEFHSQCNTSGTLYEYPIVVDVDNDDHAEIILMENSYAFKCDPITQGIHVFGHPDNQWVRTRRIWNQHTYHVTNINEDGTVPMQEEKNWTVPNLNNFRQNVQPDGLLNAPDLVPIDLQPQVQGCPEELGLSVRVTNQGRAGAPAGIPVTFYVVSGAERTKVGRAVTTRALLPGESELLLSDMTFTVPAGMSDVPQTFVAVVNDPTDDPLVGLNECRAENNESAPAMGVCQSFG